MISVIMWIICGRLLTGIWLILLRLPGRYSVYYMIDKAITLLEIYFEYVENNVHFTRTSNVESAAELVVYC